MKYSNVISFLFLAIALISSGCNRDIVASKSVNTEADLLAAANRLDSQFLDAFNAGSVDAFMACYWNDTKVSAYPPARVMELKGYNAIKEFYTKDFAANRGARLEYINNTNLVTGDAVVGHGTFRWTLSIPGRDPIVMDARHTVVKAYRDGKMVIVVDHASAPMMMEAPAGAAKSK